MSTAGYWEKHVAKTYAERLIKKGFTKATQLTDRDIKEICGDNRKAWKSLMELRAKERQEENIKETDEEIEEVDELVEEEEEDDIKKAEKMLKNLNIPIAWIQMASDEDIKMLAKDDIKTLLAMKFLRAQGTQQENKEELRIINVKSFNLPSKLPRWKGKNYLEFMDEVEITMICENIESKDWLKVLMKCVDIGVAKRLNKPPYNTMTWERAKREIRKVLEPSFCHTQAVKELIEIKPKEGETIQDYCQRYLQAFLYAECQESTKEVEIFFSTLPYSMQKTIHEARFDAITGNILPIHKINDAFELVCKLFAYRKTVLPTRTRRGHNADFNKYITRDIHCYICKRKGHISKECKYVTCFLCGGNHIASVCNKKNNGKEKQENDQSEVRNSYKNNKKLSPRKSNEKKFVNHIARRNIKNSWKKSRNHDSQPWNINTKTTFKEDEEEFKRVIHKKEVLALTDTNKLKHAFHVPITCNGHECLAMIDTGASHSFVSSNLCQSLKWIVHRSCETINLAEEGIITKQRGISSNVEAKYGEEI